MLPTDPKTPGLYYYGAIAGSPERCLVQLCTLHHDGHLEFPEQPLAMHCHPDATDLLWPRMAGSPQSARVIAQRLINAKLDEKRALYS